MLENIKVHHTSISDAEKDIEALKSKIEGLEKQLSLKDKIIELLEKQ